MRKREEAGGNEGGSFSRKGAVDLVRGGRLANFIIQARCQANRKFEQIP